MKIRTREHGRIDIKEEDIIHFVKPILCFEEFTDYVLLESKGYKRLYSLQSVEKPDIAFIVSEPTLFVRDWTPELDYEETLLEMVKAPSLSKCVLFAILNLTNRKQPTINLLGPILVNPEERLAAQGISRRPDAPNHPIHFRVH